MGQQMGYHSLEWNWPNLGMLFGVSGLLLLEWNWPKEANKRPIGAGIVDGAKLF